MKRLWFVTVSLVLLFSATLLNGCYLKQFTLQLTSTLTQAQYQAEAGCWAAAEELTQDACYRWQARSSYLHVVLRHNDTNQVRISFEETQTFLDRQETTDYCAANARLRAQISLIYEMERLSLKNVF